MLFLAAALAASAQQPQPPRNYAGASVQARATIRIISGTVLDFASAKSGDGRSVRASVIRTNGAAEPAKLIEFE